MTAQCDDAKTPMLAPWTVCCSKLLAVRLIVDHSYDCVIKTLHAVYS